MKGINDVARGQWLVERAGAWGRVGGIVGTGFESYARILHPIEAFRQDLSITLKWGQHPVVEEAHWPWSNIARRTGRVMHPCVQFRRLTDDETVMKFSDGWRLNQSSDGWLDPRLFARLTRHLTTTTPDDIVVGIWDGWGLPGQAQAYTSLRAADTSAANASESEESDQWQAAFERQERDEAEAVSTEFREAVERGPHLQWPGRRFVLLQASLDVLSNADWGYGAGIGWTTARPEPAPQLVWPQDHAWAVASEIDWDSTIVGGPRSVIDAILDDASLEAYEVSQDDDLTWDGDLINHSRTADAE